MKAIIEVAARGAIFDTVAAQLAATGAGRPLDYRLSFESANRLFAEITPARLDLLDRLRRRGPCPAAELLAALPAARPLDLVTADLEALAGLGLLEQSDDGCLTVPFETIEIILPLARVA